MSRRNFTSAQRRNRDHTAKRHGQKQANREMGAKAALAAGKAASEARLDELQKASHFGTAHRDY